MLQFQITTKEDLREAANIERRRRYEEERKGRIFNARERILGVDPHTLEQQIAEKNRRKHEELEKERKLSEEQKRRNEIINAKEQQLEKEKRRLVSEIDFYRSTYQKPQSRREFDLYDPDYNKKALPARISDQDPRLGISSAQIFIGEDLTSNERIKAQRNQQKAWLEQQMKERKNAERERLKADRLLQTALESRDKRAVELDSAEKNTRKQITEALAKYNKSLAAEQHNRRLRTKQDTEEDNMAEIYNHLTSDMLTENPKTAQSCLGLGRKITYMYRGMSAEEIQQIRRDQKAQVEEKNRKKNDLAKYESQWEQFSANVAQTLTNNDIEFDKKAKSCFKDLSVENSKLALEQKTKKDFIDQIIYTNEPTEDYFSQFNTTTR